MKQILKRGKTLLNGFGQTKHISQPYKVIMETLQSQSQTQTLADPIENPPSVEIAQELVVEPAQAESAMQATTVETPALSKPQSYTSSYYSSRSDDYLQLSHMTKKDRFPKIFDAVKRLQPDAKRILSFGCSSGEECQSLAARFSSDVEIVGVDIDYHSIKAARSNNKHPNVFFHTDVGGTGKYDIVLACMVFFCLEVPIPKERWEKMLSQLQTYVNPNGLLVIFTSDYDPKLVLGDAFDDIKVWIRKHNKNDKNYFNGYYRKKS